MSMILTADTAIINPDASIPYLENDFAIARGVTQSMLDFSNPVCSTIIGAVASGAVFNNLVAGGAAGSLTRYGDSATPVTTASIANGMITFGYPVISTNTPRVYVQLPADFSLSTKPSGTKKILFILWAKIPMTGWGSTASNVFVGGCASGTTTTNQYGLGLSHDANGNVTNIISMMPTGASMYLNPGAVMSACCDGTLHQFATIWDPSPTAGNQSITLYKDGVIIQTQSFTYDGVTFYTSGLGARLGQTDQNQGFGATGASVGRPSLSTPLTVAACEAIIAADFLSTTGYLS